MRSDTRARSFRGGIHPEEDGKSLTSTAAIRPFLPKGEAVYPLSQHIGAPAVPVVAPGDRVLVGQPIAVPNGFISAAICSAVSGTVKEIRRVRTAAGRETDAVLIENDGLFAAIDGFDTPRDPADMTADEILRAIRDAGIVGQGGAGFPTHVKLTVKPGQEPDTVIVNGAECEPYLTSDLRLMLEQPERLLAGLDVVLRLFPKAQGVIAIEDNKPEAIALLTAQARTHERVRVQRLKTKYPQGGERMLIHAVTGRDICASRLPIAAGCIVLNVSTVISVYLAVCRRVPQIATIMTVTGDGAAAPCNLRVPTGSSHREVLEAAGGIKPGAQPEKIVSGGPMMGIALPDLDVPVVKTSSSLLLLCHDEVAAWEPTACIRCGRCVRACPERLVPAELAKKADSGDLAGYEKLGGMECIECGCCTVVCPAKRRLTQSFKYARAAVAAERRAAAARAKKEG